MFAHCKLVLRRVGRQAGQTAKHARCFAAIAAGPTEPCSRAMLASSQLRPNLFASVKSSALSTLSDLPSSIFAPSFRKSPVTFLTGHAFRNKRSRMVTTIRSLAILSAAAICFDTYRMPSRVASSAAARLKTRFACTLAHRIVMRFNTMGLQRARSVRIARQCHVSHVKEAGG